jgi:hypothetical protein
MGSTAGSKNGKSDRYVPSPKDRTISSSVSCGYDRRSARSGTQMRLRHRTTLLSLSSGYEYDSIMYAKRRRRGEEVARGVNFVEGRSPSRPHPSERLSSEGPCRSRIRETTGQTTSCGSRPSR